MINIDDDDMIPEGPDDMDEQYSDSAAAIASKGRAGAKNHMQ